MNTDVSEEKRKGRLSSDLEAHFKREYERYKKIKEEQRQEFERWGHSRFDYFELQEPPHNKMAPQIKLINCTKVGKKRVMSVRFNNNNTKESN